MVRYAILGPVELCDGERRVGVGGPRQVALLALLVVNAGRAISRDALVDALWSDKEAAGAVKRLQVAVTRLRRTLDGHGLPGASALRTVSGGYLLEVAPGELDGQLFATGVERARAALQAGDGARALQQLAEALALWRGPAFAEVAYEDFAQGEIRRLEELRLVAHELQADARLALGEHGALIGELEALAAAHPNRERLAAQLMLALYRCGRQGDALHVYARTRAHLSEQLGLQPGPALQALQADVLAQSPALEHDRQAASGGGERAPAAGPKGDPMPATAALGPLTLALPRSLQLGAGTQIVGRAAELERLRERWAQVQSGTAPAAVVLGGEAGIGKTRLAGEVAGEVHERGALVLYGRCDEGLAVPYQPFVEALRPYVRAADGARLRTDLGPLAVELRRLLPELDVPGEPLRSDPETERYALFEAIAALLEAASREQPVLLVLDDLHWAAHPTLLALRHLLRSERALRVLVLATYRETELDAAGRLDQLLADLRRDAGIDLLQVRGIDERAITMMLVLDGEVLDKRAGEIARLVRVETGGNPLFVEELRAHLLESGGFAALAAREGQAPSSLAVPERVRHVIRSRVARLGDETQRVLRVACVAGQAFSAPLLEAVLGDQAVVLDALDEAVAAGVLAEAGHGEYAFGHALVRQTLYQELGSARRMQLHGQLGEALEAAGAARTSVELLAHHFAEAAAAGHAGRAADYALAASASAIERLGYEEAIGHCERGIATLDGGGAPDERRRCELLLALGEACSGGGDIERARATCLQAANAAEAIGDDQQLARAALGYCGPLFFSIGAATTEPSALLERALGRLGESDSALRARLMGRLSAALAYAGAQRRRPQLARDALAMARRVADAATLADVLATTGWSIRGPDTLEECLKLTGELAHLAEEVGDVRLRTYAQQWLVDHLLELGDIDAVQRGLDAWERRVEPLSGRHYLGWLLAVVRARHAHLRGRLDDSERFAHDAVTHGYEGQDEPVAHTFGAQLLFVRRERPGLEELVPGIERFAQLYPNIAAWRCALAYVHAELDHAEQAAAVLDDLAHEGFADLPRDGLWLGSLATLAEVAARLGDAPRAQQLYELLAPFAQRCVVLLSFNCQGSLQRQLGLLAATASRHDDAVAHFEAALEANARIGSPLWVAHTRHEYARALLAGDAGDETRAWALLHEARAGAEALGLTRLALRIDALA